MGYSPESPREMSPDTTSPYPDRPIRPLPKRRLRERLSPDVADSIKYPPAPKSTTPLFYHPYSIREETVVTGVIEAAHPTEHERADEIERNYVSRRNGDELDSDEDEAAYRSRIYSRHSADTSGRSYRYVQKPDSKHSNPHHHPPGSTASSADGYDSFENTNNKKKRKIPTPGDTILNGVHISGEVNGIGIGISGVEDLVEDVGSGVAYTHTSGMAGQGISGPGRGRYGRIRNGRSPLRTLSDASSNWGNSRSTKQRPPQWTLTESPGIITRSIANANAEKSPIAPSGGQENMSLLQQAAKKTSPASTQFTFTCDSQVPNTVPWPGASNLNSMNQSPAAQRMNIQATQTDPNIPPNLNVPNIAAQAKQGVAASQHAPATQKQGQGQTAAPKKSRRRTGKEYLVAARHRRQQQEFRNYHHPPTPEEIWICEFCEYERIFGTPPEALIRQYEIKDRRSRKLEAERRRLLEKAKLKGRKGKKGKTAPKSAAANADRAAQGQQTQQPASQSHSQGTQSEEYYEDEYEEEYTRDEPPPPSPTLSPVVRGVEHERPDPGKRANLQGAGTTVDNRITV